MTLGICEPIQGYRERLVTARKPHCCCETGRVIQVGERYWLIQGLCDGEFVTFKQCVGAYHFARKMNGHDATKNKWGGECIYGFGDISDGVAEIDDPATTEEWERVKAGEITCGN